MFQEVDRLGTHRIQHAGMLSECTKTSEETKKHYRDTEEQEHEGHSHSATAEKDIEVTGLGENQRS